MHNGQRYLLYQLGKLRRWPRRTRILQSGAAKFQLGPTATPRNWRGRHCLARLCAIQTISSTTSCRALRVAEHRRNDPSGEFGRQYGEYGIIADRVGSYDLARRFPAEVLLRSLAYESGKPIKYGASVGQSIQAIRLVSKTDEIVLNYCLNRVLTGLEPQPGICALDKVRSRLCRLLRGKLDHPAGTSGFSPLRLAANAANRRSSFHPF